VEKHLPVRRRAGLAVCERCRIVERSDNVAKCESGCVEILAFEEVIDRRSRPTSKEIGDFREHRSRRDAEVMDPVRKVLCATVDKAAHVTSALELDAVNVETGGGDAALHASFIRGRTNAFGIEALIRGRVCW
jgi:hypothetical protein